MWMQDSTASSEQGIHSNPSTREPSLSTVVGAEVFTKVDTSVLFPNVFTPQEVICKWTLSVR